jgi:hypothetical protein
MRDQNNDNQDKRSYNLKKHMERNKNLIYDYDMDADTETEKTLKSTQKIIIRRMLKKIIKKGMRLIR